MGANPVAPKPRPLTGLATSGRHFLSPDESRPHPLWRRPRAAQSHYCSWKSPLESPTAPSLLAEHGDCKAGGAAEYNPMMGFSKRKIEDARKTEADKEAAGRRATEAQILEDAERLIVAWNGRQAKRMPMPFAPTIGAAVAARHWFLWVRCPACRTTNAIDLRTLDRHPYAAITSLIPSLSCRSCRPNAPFAELVQLSRLSVTDEWNVERGRAVLGELAR